MKGEFIKKLSKEEFYKQAGYPLKEKSLSDKITTASNVIGANKVCWVRDIKQSIKRLKEEIKHNPKIHLKNDIHYTNILNMIDKIFGEKLV